MNRVMKSTICSLCALSIAASAVLAAEPARKTLTRPVRKTTEVPEAVAAEEKKAPVEVKWEELGERIRKGGRNALAVTEQIGQIEAIDYEKMKEELRENLNLLASQEYELRLAGSSAATAASAAVGAAGAANAAAVGAAAVRASVQASDMGSQLRNAADSLHEAYLGIEKTYKDLNEGDLQKDNAELVERMNEGVEQIVAGGESLFLTIATLENSRRDAQRGIDTIDRNLEELRLRNTLGQVSGQTVKGLEQTRQSTESQIAALDATIKTCKAQLQLLIGEDGALLLGPIPALDDKTLDAIDAKKDVGTAKSASRALKDAKEVFDDAQKLWWEKMGSGRPGTYKYQIDEHAYNAAKLTYEAEVERFETAFDALCRTVGTSRQTLASKIEAVRHEREVLETKRISYEKGMISKNKLLEAQDALDAAVSEEEAARLKLFQDYHAYENAMRLGIVMQEGAQ